MSVSVHRQRNTLPQLEGRKAWREGGKEAKWVLLEAALAYQELMEQSCFNVIHTFHKLTFHQHLQLSYATHVYILQKPL